MPEQQIITPDLQASPVSLPGERDDHPDREAIRVQNKIIIAELEPEDRNKTIATREVYPSDSKIESYLYRRALPRSDTNHIGEEQDTAFLAALDVPAGHSKEMNTFFRELASSKVDTTLREAAQLLAFLFREDSASFNELGNIDGTHLENFDWNKLVSNFPTVLQFDRFVEQKREQIRRGAVVPPAFRNPAIYDLIRKRLYEEKDTGPQDRYYKQIQALDELAKNGYHETEEEKSYDPIADTENTELVNLGFGPVNYLASRLRHNENAHVSLQTILKQISLSEGKSFVLFKTQTGLFSITRHHVSGDSILSRREETGRDIPLGVIDRSATIADLHINKEINIRYFPGEGTFPKDPRKDARRMITEPLQEVFFYKDKLVVRSPFVPNINFTNGEEVPNNLVQQEVSDLPTNIVRLDESTKPGNELGNEENIHETPTEDSDSFPFNRTWRITQDRQLRDHQVIAQALVPLEGVKFSNGAILVENIPELQTKLQVRREGNMTIIYQPGCEEQIEFVKNAMDYVNTFSGDGRLVPPLVNVDAMGPMTLFILDSSHLPRAAVLGDIMLLNNNSGLSTATHEMTHLLHNMAYGHSPSPTLNEGLAMYIQHSRENGYNPAHSQNIARVHLGDIARRKEEMPFSNTGVVGSSLEKADYHISEYAYGVGSRLIEVMSSLYPWEAVRSVIKLASQQNLTDKDIGLQYIRDGKLTSGTPEHQLIRYCLQANGMNPQWVSLQFGNYIRDLYNIESPNSSNVQKNERENKIKSWQRRLFGKIQ